MEIRQLQGQLPCVSSRTLPDGTLSHESGSTYRDVYCDRRDRGFRQELSTAVWAINMPPEESTPQRLKRMYGWIGVACWMLILPAKEARRFDFAIDPLVIGVAPSLLGPAGLLLVILSSERRFARLTIPAATLLAGTIALGLEFAQMLPLVRRIYRFDWLDVAATLFSLSVGALVSAGLRRRYRTAGR